jgi:hypothetical protein
MSPFSTKLLQPKPVLSNIGHSALHGGFIDDDCHGQFVKDGGAMALYGLKMDDFLLSVMVRSSTIDSTDETKHRFVAVEMKFKLLLAVITIPKTKHTWQIHKRHFTFSTNNSPIFNLLDTHKKQTFHKQNE